jgi:hypothetical protein
LIFFWASLVDRVMGPFKVGISTERWHSCRFCWDGSNGDVSTTQRSSVLLDVGCVSCRPLHDLSGGTIIALDRGRLFLCLVSPPMRTCVRARIYPSLMRRKVRFTVDEAQGVPHPTD